MRAAAIVTMERGVCSRIHRDYTAPSARLPLLHLFADLLDTIASLRVCTTICVPFADAVTTGHAMYDPSGASSGARAIRSNDASKIFVRNE